MTIELDRPRPDDSPRGTDPSSTGRTPGERVGRRLRGAGRRILTGPEGVARWEYPAFLGLLLATGVLYIVNLGANGWANSFYSAAVQAGSVDWEAFFYGSSDAANSITVDKPPASLWLMALSVRVFGLSSWSILLPEALMGVATVAVVYAAVRRHFSARTALLAGAVLALTPVATLMFRFNNPDALLVLLLTLATYFTLRGVETGRITWVLWAGGMIGLGFLTKQLQAFLILPVLAGVYLWAAPLTWVRRLGHVLSALGVVVLSAGWWVAIVELVPASMRPYVGGSQSNSFLELTFGYNGLGRLTGDETGSVGGGATAGGNWGTTGLSRLFDEEIGGQIAWLLPAALVLLVLSFFVLRKAGRIDPRRATIALFGGWLIVTAVAFSFMAGIFHAYYTVALAPAIAVVVATGASLVWSRRRRLWARIAASVVVLGTSVWALLLLMRAGDGWSVLGVVAVVLGLAAAVLLLLPARWARRGRGRALTAVTLGLTVLSCVIGPAAYSVQTVLTSHTGSIVSAGPTVAGSLGQPGAGPGAGAGAGAGGRGGFGTPPNGTVPNGTAPTGKAPTGTAPNGGTAGTAPNGGTTGTPGAFGGTGGLLGGGSVSSEVVTLLDEDASAFTWVAAAVGSNNASGYQLESGDPVMAIGGFNGSDPSPTLAQFQQYVADGDIHWFIESGSLGRSSGGSDASSQIATWVADTFTAQTVDGVSLYDLTS